MRSNKNYILFIFYVVISFPTFVYSQTIDVKSYNAYIDFLNDKILKINYFNNNVSEYNSQLQQYFEEFDSIKIQNLNVPKYAFYNRTISRFPETESLLNSLFEAELKLDSVSQEYKLSDDTIYSEITIQKLNNQAIALQNVQKNILNYITQIKLQLDKNTKNSDKKVETKKTFYVINQELDSIKKGKWTYKEFSYFMKEQSDVQNPTVLKAFEEFYTLYGACSHPKDSIAFLATYAKHKNTSLETWRTMKKGVLEYELLYEKMYRYRLDEKSVIQHYNESIESNERKELIPLQPIITQVFTFDSSKFGPFSPEEPDIFLTLIIDISNSMNKYGRIGLLKQSLLHIVDDFRKKDKLIIVSFSDTSSELFTVKETNKQTQKNKISKIIASGGTFPDKAIERSYNIMNINSKDDKNNRVILITDGNFDTNSKMKFLVRQGLHKNITFSIIRIDGDAISENDVEKLRQLTVIGKGNYYTIGYDQEVYSKIIEEIKSLRK